MSNTEIWDFGKRQHDEIDIIDILRSIFITDLFQLNK